MHEITCPNCHTVFVIDDTAYAEILSQVRDEAFEKAIHERLANAQKDTEIAVAKAEGALRSELLKVTAAKDQEVLNLQAKLDLIASAHKLELSEAVKALEKDRDKLQRDLEAKDAQHELSQVSMKDKYEAAIREREDMIEQLRDYKARMSTKMIGEALEQYCEAEFNAVRASTFPNAYFEKDNDASSGSKGDFIFRDYDQDGTEFVSIMFEMKNEADTTATRKKNEDFFKELDKDRKEKDCEYAVLVSLLEADSDLYNRGIIDVSHRYPKMFVIRPQFFIPMISLLRNAASNSLVYRKELAQVKAQSIDIVNFENQINEFKEKFGKNYTDSTANFEKAIDQIDASIKALEKVKEHLRLSAKHLRYANDKAQDLTIKKLAKGNPAIMAKFEELPARAIEAASTEDDQSVGEQ